MRAAPPATDGPTIAVIPSTMRPVQLGSTLSLIALFVVGCSDHVERLDEARQAKSGSAAVVPGGTGLPTTPNSGVVPPLPGSGTGNPGVPGLPGSGTTGAVTCQPKAPQAAPLWRPPSPPRKACTQQEGAAVVSCMLQKQGCQTPVSAACQSCAITVKGQGSYYGPIIVDPANVSIEILPPSTVDRCDGSRQTPASTWTITLRDTDAAIARGESSTLAQAVVSMIDEIDRRHADAMLLLEKVKP